MDDALIAVGVTEEGGGLAVDARGVWLGGGQHLDRGAEDPGGEGQGIGAEVEEGATGQVGTEDAVAGAEVLAEFRQYGADVAEDAGVEDLPDDVEPGKEEGPQGLRAEQAAVRSELGDLRGLDGVWVAVSSGGSVWVHAPAWDRRYDPSPLIIRIVSEEADLTGA